MFDTAFKKFEVIWSVLTNFSQISFGLECFVSYFFSEEMNIYTANMKTRVNWNHDYYVYQG